MAYFGYYGVQTEEIVIVAIAAAALIAGLMLIVMAPLMPRPGYGRCPLCGAKMRQMSGPGEGDYLVCPRPIPLRHRANMAQMKNGLYLSMTDSWGSGQHGNSSILKRSALRPCVICGRGVSERPTCHLLGGCLAPSDRLENPDRGLRRSRY